MKHRERVKKRILEKIAAKTRTLGVELTTYCPLQCKYCTRNMLDRKDRTLSQEKLLELKEKLADFQRLVICGMGEPMTYPYLYDTTSMLEQKIILITSGTMLIDYEKLNRRKNIEVIVFSIDAPTREEMVEITGNYKWENLMQNLKRSRYNSRVSKVINCTVTKYNYRRIPDLTRFAILHRLQGVSFTMEIRRTDDTGVGKEIHKYLEEAVNIANRGGIAFTSSYEHIKCMSWGDVVPYADINGDFFPCCQGVNRKYKVGNIFTSTFAEIWDSPAYKKFKKGNMCIHDCPLYSDITQEDKK